MKRLSIMAAALAATTALGCAAYAADASSAPSDQTTISDFQKSSRAGAHAYNAMSEARVALFDGDTQRAETLVSNAQKAFDKAKTEGAAFVKAEQALNPPADAPKQAPATADAGRPVSWIPVDARMSVTEDFRLKSEKAAKMEKTSDEASSKRTPRLDVGRPLDVRASYTLAVVPVDKVSESLSNAAADLKAGKFYEANLALKQGQDSVRFDVASVDDVMPAPARKAHDRGAAQAQSRDAQPAPAQTSPEPAPRS